MEAGKHRNIQNGEQHDSLFPSANLKDETVKKGATVSDTVRFIPKVVRETLPQTEKISEMLRGNSLSETCKNIWDFVYNHIRYYKDDEGKEQIRSPARTWHDRSRGVDCDCYTVFISSILTNLKIPHRLRIARYKKDYFQHIYPVVPKRNGNHITIDCVVDYFNYEEPYTEIKDTTMDLEYLSGLDDTEGVGKLFKKKSGGGEPKKGGLKNMVKKAVHLTNKVNPATVLLRNGLLASMKLNIFKIAQRMKYAYLSEEEAKKKGVDMTKFQKLKSIKDKLESIFYGAGGKPENLKKAILTGKGNKGGKHDVNGIDEMDEAASLRELIGQEIYDSENEERIYGMDGFGELGEPVTAASITAATGALAAIAGLLKGIGNIFPKKDKEGSKDFENMEKEGDAKNLPSEIEKNKEEMSKMEMDSSSDSSQKKSSDSSSADDSEKEGFWEKNKKWLKPTMWGAGGLSLLYLGYRAISGKKENPAPKTLSGPKKSGKSKPRHKPEQKKKTEVKWM